MNSLKMPRIVLKLPENGKTAESLSTLPRGNLPTMGREYPRNTRSASEGSIGVSVLLLRMQADISALSRRGGPGATKPEIAEVGSHMLGTGAKLSRHRRGDCDLSRQTDAAFPGDPHTQSPCMLKKEFDQTRYGVFMANYSD